MTASEAAEYHAPRLGHSPNRGRHGHRADARLRRRGDRHRPGRGGGGVPAALSFTVETDGRLPSGQSLRDAVETVDDRTGQRVAYFMINCAHPTHFASALEPGAPWAERIRGLRANASAKSHAELDASEELDEGDPLALADDYRDLVSRMPGLAVLGGCCGTDHRHISAICATHRR